MNKQEICLNYCLFISIFAVFFFFMMSIGSFINMETLVLKKGKHTDSGYACVICTIIYGVIMAICIYKKCCENKKLNDESEAKENKSLKSDEANINVEEIMKKTLTMIYWKGERYWPGKLLEHPEIMTQGETVEELEKNIQLVENPN